MYKRCFVLVVLTFSLSTLLISDTADCDKRKCFKTIQDVLDAAYVLIDPGHGGEESGAEGSDGTLEKDLNFDISKLLKNRLMQLGIKNVDLTREKHEALDIILLRTPRIKTLFARAKKASKGGCEEFYPFFISIHNNGDADSSVKGTEEFYAYLGENWLPLIVHNSLMSLEGLRNKKDRGVKNGINSNPYYMYILDCMSSNNLDTPLSDDLAFSYYF
jgi:N-acetylmuramoyl-L-alanine amidase